MDKFKIEHDAARLALGAMFEGPLHNNSRGALCDDFLLFVLEPFPFGNSVLFPFGKSVFSFAFPRAVSLAHQCWQPDPRRSSLGYRCPS
jgi:hypothetical protein